MEFSEDAALNRRLGDLEFNGLAYDPAIGDLCFHLTYDPIETGRLLRFRSVRTFDVSGFGLQNVISHLEYVALSEDRISDFVSIANAEIGRAGLFLAGRKPGPWLGTILVPSNGAIAFAVCALVELCDADGRVLHWVSA